MQVGVQSLHEKWLETKGLCCMLLTGFSPQFLEEPLVEDERHTADLLHLGLGRGVPVLEVGRDGDGQLPPELLALEP